VFCPPVGLQFISEDFNTELEDSRSLAIADNKEIFLVGDLNAYFVPRQKTDGVSRELKDSLKGFGMSQLINEPTGIAKRSSTLIDVILSAHPPKYFTNESYPTGYK